MSATRLVAVERQAAREHVSSSVSRTLRSVAAYAGWAVVAAAVVVRLLQFTGTPNRWVAAIQSLTPWGVPVVVLVAVAALVTRRWRLGASASVMVIAFVPLIGGLTLHGERTNIDVDGGFSVAVSNVLYDNPTPADAFDAVLAQHADVVVLWEMSRPQRDVLTAHSLADEYPEHHDDPAGIGVVILSRFPIEFDESSWSTTESQAVVIDTPEGPVRFLVTHPPPPVFDADTWNSELDALAAEAIDDGVPTVVAGDLNAGWFHPPFRDLLHDAGLTDALPAAGADWSMTWPTDEITPPFVALDHILFDELLGVAEAGTFEVPGADHRGITARLGRNP